MIVVIGNPRLELAEPRPRAAGQAVEIAAVAAAEGSDVQLVGKVGEDPAGDAVLIGLAERAIGHVAVLRDPGAPTGVVDPATDADASPFDDADDADDPVAPDSGAAPGDTPRPEPERTGPAIEAADLELALRYLPDYQVLIVGEPLTKAALVVAAAAAGWSGAALVAVVATGAPAPVLPDDATVLQAPAEDPDGVFAAIVGRYAAALDRGDDPAAAFAAAADALGWAPAAE